MESPLVAVPDVYKSAAVSPTIRPMARIIPERIPGTAAGRTTLNMVLNLPVPRAKLPSLYESGTASSASLVVLNIVGSTIIAAVAAPAISE